MAITTAIRTKRLTIMPFLLIYVPLRWFPVGRCTTPRGQPTGRSLQDMGEQGIRRTHDPAGKWRADPLGRTPLDQRRTPESRPPTSGRLWPRRPSHRLDRLMKIRILCTLGPASLQPDVLRGLDERGTISTASTFPTPRSSRSSRRSSSSAASPPPRYPWTRRGRRFVAATSRTVWCWKSGDELTLTGDTVTGSRRAAHPVAAASCSRHYAPGLWSGSISTACCCEWRPSRQGEASASVLRGGRVRSNKAVTMDPAPSLPALSEKDRAAIVIGAHARDHALRAVVREPRPGRRSDARAGPCRGADHGQAREPLGVRNMDGIIEADGLRLDRSRRPVPRGSVRIRPVLSEGHRAASEPGEPPGLRRDEPPRVDGHEPHPDDRRGERHREHAARRRARAGSRGRDGDRHRSPGLGRPGASERSRRSSVPVRAISSKRTGRTSVWFPKASTGRCRWE